LSSVGIAKLLLAINGTSGGFVSLLFSITLKSIEQIPLTIDIITLSLLKIFNCDPTGLSPIGTILAIFRMPLIFLVSLSVYQVIKNNLIFFTKKNSQSDTISFIDTALYLVILANITSLIFTVVFQDFGDIRFLLPAWAALSILTARHMPANKNLLFYCAIIAFLAIRSDITALTKGAALQSYPLENVILTRALEQRDLHYGYAPYWQASDITVESADDVTIRAIIADKAHSIMPYRLFSKSDWYAGQTQTSNYFIVIPKNEFWFSKDDVINRFGQPNSSFTVNDTLVYVYRGALPALN
jgi:hypothetical protein